MPDKNDWNNFLSRAAWAYRWRKWWPVIGMMVLGAGITLALLFLTGCFLDSPNAQQHIDGGAAVAGTVANAIVPGSGAIITPLISAIGAGVLGLWTLKRERDNRVATKAIEVQAESIDKLLPKITDTVELKLVKDKMLAAQVATGTHRRIQAVRGKPVKAA